MEEGQQLIEVIEVDETSHTAQAIFVIGRFGDPDFMRSARYCCQLATLALTLTMQARS